MEKKRLIYMDIMKVFAIFFVIFNHMDYRGYSFFMKLPTDSVFFFVFLFLSVFCKFAIPLFLMISGALLLNKDNLDFGYIVRRIFKLLFIIVLFSVLRVAVRAYLSSGEKYYDFFSAFGMINYNYIFKRIYQNPIEGDFWFLYYYASVLFVFPFLYIVVKGFQQKHFYYLLILFLLFGCALPCFEHLFSMDGLPVYEPFRNRWINTFYPVIGYYLEHKMKPVSNKRLAVLWGVNLLTIFISMYLTYDNIYSKGEVRFSEDFHGLFAAFNAAVLYITFKRGFENVSEKSGKVLTFLSKSVFTVYLMHFNVYLFLLFPKIWSEAENNVFLSVFLMADTIVSVFLICVSVYYVLSKIPVVKKITYL